MMGILNGTMILTISNRLGRCFVFVIARVAVYRVSVYVLVC